MDKSPSHNNATDLLRLVILVGSVRTDRIGHQISRWVHDNLDNGPWDDLDVQVIDLAKVSLPDDELLQPGGSVPTEISERLHSADAFVVVAPEYNASIPARLKSALDWHYREWPRKPAMIVSYGALGGHMAAQALRSIFAELSVVTTRRYIALSRPWEQIGEYGYRPGGDTDDALRQAAEDLLWWTRALRDARRAQPVATG